MSAHEQINGASVELTHFLEWDETDAAGHQHYASIFGWVEACESALYRKLGLPSTLFGQIPRVKVEMQYRRRIFFWRRNSIDFESSASGKFFNGVCVSSICGK